MTQETMKKVGSDSIFLPIDAGSDNRYRIVSGIKGVKQHGFQVGDNWRFPICPTAQKNWENETNGTNEEVPQCPLCLAGTSEKMKKVGVQFFALAIDRKTGKLGVLKQGIMLFKIIMAMAHDEDWGDLSQYDIKVTKTGEGKETKYSALGVPNKTPLTDEEKKMIEESDIDLDKMCIPNDFDKLVEIAGIDPEKIKSVVKGDIPFA